MADQNFNRDVIVVADLSGLSNKDKVEKIGVYGTLMTDNPLIVPNISPTGAILTTKVGLIEEMMLKHKTIEEILIALTKEIKKQIKEASDIVVKEWVPQVHKACNGNIVDITTLGFGVKNSKVLITPATRGRITNSNPIISNIDTSVHLKHDIFVINSKTVKLAKLVDALQTNVYGQIGGVVPNDVNKMVTFGIIDRGNYLHEFDPADLGKPVYYMAAYLSKKTRKPVAVSPLFSAFIG